LLLAELGEQRDGCVTRKTTLRCGG